MYTEFDYAGVYLVSTIVDIIGVIYLFAFIKEPPRKDANNEDDNSQEKEEDKNSENIIVRFFKQLWSKFGRNCLCFKVKKKNP